MNDKTTKRINPIDRKIRNVLVVIGVIPLSFFLIRFTLPIITAPFWYVKSEIKTEYYDYLEDEFCFRFNDIASIGNIYYTDTMRGNSTYCLDLKLGDEDIDYYIDNVLDREKLINAGFNYSGVENYIFRQYSRVSTYNVKANKLQSYSRCTIGGSLNNFYIAIIKKEDDCYYFHFRKTENVMKDAKAFEEMFSWVDIDLIVSGDY